MMKAGGTISLMVAADRIYASYYPVKYRKCSKKYCSFVSNGKFNSINIVKNLIITYALFSKGGFQNQHSGALICSAPAITSAELHSSTSIH